MCIFRVHEADFTQITIGYATHATRVLHTVVVLDRKRKNEPSAHRAATANTFFMSKQGLLPMSKRLCRGDPERDTALKSSYRLSQQSLCLRQTACKRIRVLLHSLKPSFNDPNCHRIKPESKRRRMPGRKSRTCATVFICTSHSGCSIEISTKYFILLLRIWALRAVAMFGHSLPIQSRRKGWLVTLLILWPHMPALLMKSLTGCKMAALTAVFFGVSKHRFLTNNTRNWVENV